MRRINHKIFQIKTTRTLSTAADIPSSTEISMNPTLPRYANLAIKMPLPGC